MSKIYKTLEQLVNEPFEEEESILQDLELGVAGKWQESPKITYFYQIILYYFDITGPDASWNTDDLNTLFCTYIYPKYKTMAVAYGETQTEVDKEAYNFLVHLLNKIKTSRDEYKKLIDLFDSIKDNLLSEIKSQTKFNDTPQTTTTAGITSYDDTYNTTVSTTYNDGASKIARLAEVEAYIKDYYSKWRDAVCGGLFIYED